MFQKLVVDSLYLSSDNSQNVAEHHVEVYIAEFTRKRKQNIGCE